CFQVDHPRRRSLLSVRRIETSAHGRERGGRYETEVEAEIDSISVLEKLHIDFIKLHLRAISAEGEEPPSVSTNGNRIEGVHLGVVEAKIELDEEPLHACGTKEQLADFYRNQTEEYRRQHGWRFNMAPAGIGVYR